jgi:hypothetical protein
MATTPAEQNIAIVRGDTVTVVVTITSNGTTPINITGRTYSSMVRMDYDSSTPSATFTCVVTNGAAGEVTLSLSAASTALMTPYTYVWDLQENASGVISTLLAGQFVILPDVTR